MHDLCPTHHGWTPDASKKDPALFLPACACADQLAGKARTSTVLIGKKAGEVGSTEALCLRAGTVFMQACTQSLTPDLRHPRVLAGDLFRVCRHTIIQMQDLLMPMPAHDNDRE